MGKVVVLKTENSIFFVCGVRYVNRESQKSVDKTILWAFEKYVKKYVNNMSLFKCNALDNQILMYQVTYHCRILFIFLGKALFGIPLVRVSCSGNPKEQIKRKMRFFTNTVPKLWVHKKEI